MNEQELNKWKFQNERLQREYQNYCMAYSQKEKEMAKFQIQQILCSSPLIDYINEQHPFAHPFGITKYGLDSETEKSINEIDEIAKGIRIYK